MNKTKIDWCDYTWNPITGCKRACAYCYAKTIHDRFNKTPYSEIQLHEERLTQPLKEKKPSRIFVGSMSDIEYWNFEDTEKILDVIDRCPQHTFIFLTKGVGVYERYNFPKNCWLGQSTTDGYWNLPYTGNLMFLSIEPLLQEPMGPYLDSALGWVIVGGLTPKPFHKKEWIDSIVEKARRLNIPIFIKHNANYPIKIQEFPKR